MFVCWCYQVRHSNRASSVGCCSANGEQERLRALGPHWAHSTPADRILWRETLLDLWVFADHYSIAKLQNQVMRQLTSLFATPTLLTKVNVEYIFLQRTTSEALRDLAVLTLVARLEAPSVASVDIEEFGVADLARLEGFVVKLYKALQDLTTFEVPENKRRGKWALMLREEGVQQGLKVTDPRQEGTEGAARPQARTATARGRGTMLGPFAPGEVVEID